MTTYSLVVASWDSVVLPGGDALVAHLELVGSGRLLVDGDGEVVLLGRSEDRGLTSGVPVRHSPHSNADQIHSRGDLLRHDNAAEVPVLGVRDDPGSADLADSGSLAGGKINVTFSLCAKDQD